MSITLYSASLPVFRRMLVNLKHILNKAEEHAQTYKIDPSVLLGYRLHPTMFALKRQIQIASDNAKGAAGRLSGRDIPRFEDTEESFAQLQERLDRTIAFLDGFGPADIDGREDTPVTVKLPSRELQFTAIDYLTQYGLPNFFFHVNAAYAILRHAGVDLGKRDYLGN